MELKELKQKVNNAQESLTIDGDVAKQEEECAWFRSETSRLTIHQDNMVQDMKSMNHRFRTLKEQVSYLSDQLKAVMKRSKIMEAELKGIDEAKIGSTGGSVGTKSLASNTTKTSSPYNKFVKRKNPPNFNDSKLQSLQRSQSRNVFKLNNMANTLNHQVTKDLTEIEENRNIIDIELEDSIKATLKVILDRRSEEVARSLKSRKAMKELRSKKESDDTTKLKLHENDSVDGVVRSVHPSSTKCEDVGLSGLGMSKFTPTDKFAALCHFLSKPAVFEIVVDKLNIELKTQAEERERLECEQQLELEGNNEQQQFEEMEMMMNSASVDKASDDNDNNKSNNNDDNAYSAFSHEGSVIAGGVGEPTPIAETEKIVGFSDSQTVASSIEEEKEES